MNKLLSGVLVAAAVTTFATGAKAQEGQQVQKPFSIKIGGLFFSGDTKDAIGNSTLSVGLGYDFIKTRAENPVVVQGYLDYFASKSGEETLGAARLETKLDYAIGVGAAARYQLVRATETQSFFPYVGLGLGVYSVKGSSTLTGTENDFDDDENKTGLGGKLVLGAELKQGFLGEIEYNWIPKIGDANLSGFGLRIGYRF